MATDDGYYAIIVGIKYADQGLDTLKGPENDAQSFYEWVVSPDGGGVPDDDRHRSLILSSRFSGAVEPTAARVIQAFEAFNKIAMENADAGRRRSVGKRLYIYLAGHGFAPSQLDDETGLLVADAKFGDYGQHILGRYCADWAYKANYFDEILLFMDCCRTPVQANPVLKREPLELNAADFQKVRRFYCFACLWSFKAYEREMPPDKKWRGVFTTALLQGLNGAAADSKGKVTGDSLYRYLKNFTQCFMSAQELADKSIPKEPDIFSEPERGGKILITTLKGDRPKVKDWLLGFFSVLGFSPPTLKGYKVKFMLPADAAGEEVEVYDSKLNPVSGKLQRAAGAGASENLWELELESGYYFAKFADSLLIKTFVVGCGGTVNVDLTVDATA